MNDPLVRGNALYAQRLAAADAEGQANKRDAAASTLGMILSGLDIGDPARLLAFIYEAGFEVARQSADAGLSADEAVYSACVVCFSIGALTAHAAQEGT